MVTYDNPGTFQRAVLERDVKGYAMGTVVYVGEPDPYRYGFMNEYNVIMPDSTIRTMYNDATRLCR